MSLDGYTCETCGHSQREHWHQSRRDNNRSYCTKCPCNHFKMMRPGEEPEPSGSGTDS